MPHSIEMGHNKHGQQRKLERDLNNSHKNNVWDIYSETEQKDN